MRDTTKLTRENMGQNDMSPVIDRNASLKQAWDQFSEELYKMLDKAAPQKNDVCKQTTQILVQ